MLPLAFGGLGAPELLIILAVVLLLFGGSRLAGLGKSTGRALKEFKEETKGLKSGEKVADPSAPVENQPPALGQQTGSPSNQQWSQPPAENVANPAEPDLRKDV